MFMKRKSIFLIVLMLCVILCGCAKKAEPIGDEAHATDQKGSEAICDEFFKDLILPAKYIITTTNSEGTTTRTFDDDKVYVDNHDENKTNFYLFVENDAEYCLDEGTSEATDGALIYAITMQLEGNYMPSCADSMLYGDYEGLQYDTTYKKSTVNGKEHKEMTMIVTQESSKSKITLSGTVEDNKVMNYFFEEMQDNEVLSRKEGTYQYSDDIEVIIPEHTLPQ